VAASPVAVVAKPWLAPGLGFVALSFLSLAVSVLFLRSKPYHGN
jgi:hypothetical protein